MRRIRFLKEILAVVLVAVLAAPLSVLASEVVPEPVQESSHETVEETSQPAQDSSHGTVTETNTEPETESTQESEGTETESTETETTGESDSTEETEKRPVVRTVILPTNARREPIVSVMFPSLSDEGPSPLDFLIDPQQLVYATDAAKYGGGRVDEGATMLFRNHGGEYDFSRYSDKFTFRNQSNVPVIVTVTARITNLEEIEMVSNTNFGDSEACSMYMAVVDDEGNERPLIEDGSVTLEVRMQAAPENAYIYNIDNETGSYSYEMAGDPDSIGFDQYSFGLVGYCNPNGNWEDMTVAPRVTLTWTAEPILPDPEPEQVITEEIQEEPVEEPEKVDSQENQASEAETPAPTTPAEPEPTSEPEPEPDTEPVEPEPEPTSPETATATPDPAPEPEPTQPEEPAAQAGPVTD
ncbi:hypothetical protein [Pseudobutyrivibrio sp. LB2011]|uniref:hypothetical protein n=1 Tax=Pseudobutyrivibrio sp. LB2011 TaxID=1408312 RepID=UPI00067933AC|nr:hypothetical protein [Pseudobutyrivibrio sp. LB2011]